MDKRQRIALQRAMCREAIGKLRAAAEFFAAEDGAVSGITDDSIQFMDHVDELESWIFQESSLS